MNYSIYFRIAALAGSVLLAGFCAGQAPPPYTVQSANSITTFSATSPQTSSGSLSTLSLKEANRYTQLIDGLGRPFQTVARKGSLVTDPSNPASSTDAVDLVSNSVYDVYGREVFGFLPFAANPINGNTSVSDGNFKKNPFEQLGQFAPLQYPDESFFYSKTVTESSPLGRVTETYAPGASWAGSESDAKRSVKIKYGVNTVSDAVRHWAVTIGALGSFSSYSNSAYAAGVLTKVIQTDENGKQVVEFKDKAGNIVLKKVQLMASPDEGMGSPHDGWLNTYYIYDDFNWLRCVIQPNGVDQIEPLNWVLTDPVILGEQCFRYEYDAKGRVIIKKVPGAGAQQMVYDSRNRLVLSRDGNLTAQGNKWLYTQYDPQNRPISTGIWTTGTSFTAHITAAATIPSVTVSNYPAIGASGLEELSTVFYDTYDFLTLPAYSDHGLPGGLYTNDHGHLEAPSNTVWPYPQPVAIGPSTRSMQTGSRVKVQGTSTWLYTASYYDRYGRLIQAQLKNMTGGVDINTTQYSFSGQPLLTIQRTEKAGTPAQTTVVVTRLTYDDLGRLLKTEKKLSNTLVSNNVMSAFVTTSSLQYDALGQLKKKSIGSKKDAANAYISPRQPLQELDHDYNIRGWLLGVNLEYLTTAGQTTDGRLFGFELGYDKLTNRSDRSFTTQQWNGNITGILWKSDGDDTRRKYDFTYDAANRLLKGDFEQQNPNNNWNNSIANFNIRMGDGNSPTTAYDANGNIRQMQQWGLKLGSSSQLDNMRYTYIPGTNRIKNVTDFNNDVQTKLGDFKTNATHPQQAAKAALSTSSTQAQFDAITDYAYDANGNLIKDDNKGISSITYNHLNLPQVITIATKGTITYTYDAKGNKLNKITVESPTTANGNKTISTTTTYLPGAVYESKTTSPTDPDNPDYTDRLLFVAHEEGRIRFKEENNTFEYDYFIKDHLGNVRMVLTEEQQTNAYPPASMEPAQATEEEKLYANLPETRYDKSSISGYPTDNYTDPNGYVARVKAATGMQKVGPSIALKVMSGDKFNLRVSSWYKKNGVTPGTPLSPLTDLVAALVSGVGGAAVPVHGSTITVDLESSGILSPEATGFLNSRSYTTGRPKAYLNWILLDEQFKYVSTGSGFEQVGDDEVFTVHVKSELPVTKNGYLYVYVSNETPNIDVFFDNLQVTHIRGPILEETHYYPFGLTMAGISSKALAFGNPENRFKYNGIEQNNDFDLNMYDAFYRNLDPQIGRFWQIDPKPTDMFSPYAAMANNPIRYSDPLGDTTWVYTQKGQLLGVINDKMKNQVHFMDNDGKVTFDGSKLTSKQSKAMANAIRKTSIAFMGSKTAGDMKSIAEKSINSKVEVGFVGKVGEDKEIRLEALDTKGNTISSTNTQNLEDRYSAEAQNDIFLEGHTHIQAYVGGWTFGDGSDLANQKGAGEPTRPDDYTPILNRGSVKGAAPALVATPWGVTIYGTTNTPPRAGSGVSKNNTYLGYKSLKGN